MDSGYTDPHRDLKSEDEWYAAHLLRQKDKPNPMQVCADCGRDYPEDMTECPFCEVSRVTGEPVPPKGGRNGAKGRTDGATFRYKEIRLMLDDKDRPIWNMANAITLLTDHADWRGVLAFNSFTMRRVLLRAIPGQKTGEFPRPLEDDDYSAAQAWFNRNFFPKAGAEIVSAAMRKVCRDRTYDPLRDYLDGLVWDGSRRLASWLTIYCGVEINEYTSEVGVRWCISAVARGYKPGCKADHMLVMEGAQGRRKSSALAALTGPDWFSDSLPQMGTKDASSYLRGKWVVEVAELEAMRKEVDQIKAFISRQVETFRPAYAREEVSEPRRCVFAGTTNKDDWQRDETGGRRFWPVKVGAIDVDALDADRDQIWAEAVTLYRAGERWWLEGEAETVAQAEVAERGADDPWRADIAKAEAGYSEITNKQVLSAMGVLPSEMTPQLSKRVAKELIIIGWERQGRITSGESKGAYRYVPSKGQ
jgi:predicted P-loop ATPase